MFRHRVILTIIALLALVYLPFFGDRVLPPGDPKVYAQQSVEMIESGSWFLQTWMGEPNYYKGPGHYLLIRAGHLIFGDSLWALLYMNFLFLVLGVASIAGIIYSKTRDETKTLFGSVVLLTSAGIYGHVYASQMEIELFGIFSFVYYLLTLGRKSFRSQVLIWALIGVAGWFKSPLHSVFLGLSAILFWICTNEIKSIIRDPRAWAAWFIGVAVGFSAYLPILILDFDSFYNTYWLRESSGKAMTAMAEWWKPLASTFVYFQFPWLFLFFLSYWRGLMRLARREPVFENSENRLLFLTGVCLLAPSVIFFLFYPYRLEFYHLPSFGGTALILISLLPKFETLSFRLASSTSALLIAFLAALSFGISFWVSTQEPWMSIAKSYTVGLLGLLGAVALLVFTWRQTSKNWLLAVPASTFALSLFFTTLFQKEIDDLETVFAQIPEDGEIAYANLRRYPWAECGHLAFETGRKIKCLATEAEFEKHVRAGNIVIFHRQRDYDYAKNEKLLESEQIKSRRVDWRRWGTHAHLRVKEAKNGKKFTIEDFTRTAPVLIFESR